VLKDVQLGDAECFIVKFEDGMFHKGPDSNHPSGAKWDEWLNDGIGRSDFITFGPNDSCVMRGQEGEKAIDS
jgi:hypothetical protein